MTSDKKRIHIQLIEHSKFFAFKEKDQPVLLCQHMHDFHIATTHPLVCLQSHNIYCISLYNNFVPF